MAEVTYLNIHDDNEDDENDAVLHIDSSIPYWSPLDFDIDLSVRPHQQISTVHSLLSNDAVSDHDSLITYSDLFHRENQVNFVIDLFHQRVEQSQHSDPNFCLVEPNHELGATHFEVNNFGSGLGFYIEDDESENNNSVFEEQFMGGLRVVDIGSDSESEENGVIGIDLNETHDFGLVNEDVGRDDFGLVNENIGHDVDDGSGFRVSWDSFRLEDGRNAIEEFEWEEVDGRVDEREVLSVFLEAEGDDSSDVNLGEGEVLVGGVERVEGLRNLEWEVLLNIHNLEVNSEIGHDGDFILGDQDAEYEMLFGQFEENESSMIGRPPAAKMVVRNLPSVVLTKEDVESNNSVCAICKDDMSVGEKAKKLPCSHRYHGDCIVPWLVIRNTCPVCRYELPTDDSEYEQRRAQRAGRAQ